MSILSHNEKRLTAGQPRRTGTPARHVAVDGQECPSYVGRPRLTVGIFSLALLACAAALTGCTLTGNNFSLLESFRPPPKCVLPPEMTKEQVVRHLNANCSRIQSWQSTEVGISMAAMPGMRLSASIAVEQPRNFRLRAGLLGADVADLGSNRERFWFWMKRSPDRYVLTSSHQDAGRVQQMMKLPFQPDWLMEALGVIPLDGSQFEMLPAAEPDGVMTLISDQVTDAGRPVRRVILIDTCQGYIVAHELYDVQSGQQQLIARAELNDYRVDRASGAALPHRINFDWPQAGMALTLKIGDIDVNPASIPAQTWDVPHVPGYPPLDLGELTRSVEPAGRARVSAAAGDSPSIQPAAGNGSELPLPNSDAGARQAAPGQPRQTAEIPEWASGGAEPSADEPPWHDGSSSPLPGGGQSQRSGAGRTPTQFASLEDEPPWDDDTRRRPARKAWTPTSVLDFIKAPFTRRR